LSSIGSATSTPSVQPAAAKPVSRPRDADGDNDGTKAAASKTGSQPLATSGSLGTRVNATA